MSDAHRARVTCSHELLMCLLEPTSVLCKGNKLVAAEPSLQPWHLPLVAEVAIPGVSAFLTQGI